MQTIEEYKAYCQQLEGEVGKWHHAYDALMVESNQLVNELMGRKLEDRKMTSEKFIKFRNLIEDEFSKAVTKHPKFCDSITPPGFDFDEEEKRWKKWNDESEHHYSSDILNEEIAEALNAYTKGDKEHCLQELAQCGAVILRMMEFVEKEK